MGRRGGAQTRSWQPWPLRSPGACLCSVESFSLFFGPIDTSPHPGWLGRGGGGGEPGEALGKEKEAKNRSSGTAAKKRARMPRLGRRQPSQVPWRAGTCWKPEPWLAGRGRTVEPAEGGGPQGGRGGGLSESYKLETEGMSSHLHFLPLLMGIISLAPSFLEANFK